MKKLAVLVCFIGLAMAGPASARLVNFDSIPSHGQPYGAIPSGWASFDWSTDFDWINPAEDAPRSGYQYGMVSAPNVAFNASGANVSFQRNPAFELVSFYLAGAWRNGLEVKVTGMAKGVEVDSTTFTVNASAPTLETLDWDVNKVTFRSFGGTSAGYGADGNQFVMDNLTTLPLSGLSTAFRSVDTVPEASTWALMLLGFAGLGCAGYRRATRERAALAAA